MQIIRNTTEFQLEKESAVVIGKFDGLHLGHQKLFQHIYTWKERGMKCVAFTFDLAPTVFLGQSEMQQITTVKEKRILFAELGVDILIEFPMNEITAAIPAEKFIEDILVKQMHTGFICAGADLSFGKKGRGNYILLEKMSKQNDYQVEIVEKVMYDDKEISSSFVREEIKKGNMEIVSVLLGRNYQIVGTVINGKHFGRTIGMPTVNLEPEKDKLLPPMGVYYSLVSAGEKKFNGVTNVGYKPTVSNESVLGVETYLYGFEGDLYGEELKVEFLSFKRPEIKFSDIVKLKEQMEADFAEGKRYFEERDC